ncbi:MAG TPA: hypothetical protein VJH03_07970 [Blastocatellia bacterium]|nr:hypothetical protein [Blastocatellia bacterium]
MTREQLIAQALVAWLDDALRTERDVASEGLPDMDVGWFLAQLAGLSGFPVEQVSLALVGFGAKETDLRALADKHGLRKLRHLATDLNSAAAWRNEHKQHPRIIALARGRHPSVHTLKHFAQAHSRDLAAPCCCKRRMMRASPTGAYNSTICWSAWPTALNWNRCARSNPSPTFSPSGRSTLEPSWMKRHSWRCRNLGCWRMTSSLMLAPQWNCGSTTTLKSSSNCSTHHETGSTNSASG